MVDERYPFEVQKRDVRGRLRSVLFETQHEADGFAELLVHGMALRGSGGSVRIIRGPAEDLVFDNLSAEEDDEPDEVAV